MLRRYVALLSLLIFAPVTDQTRAASGWRPVTQQELRMTAADIGDPEADAAILFREGELNDNDPEGTSLKVYIRIKIFTDRGRLYGNVQLPYKVELGKINDVRARTIRPDGSTVEVEGRDIFDRLLIKTSNAVHRAKVFSMPAVEAGSIIEYRYRQIYPQGFRYFALDLQSELFTRELHYRIQPQSASRLDVRWVTFNAQDPKRFAPTWDGTYDIKVQNIPAFRREPLMPPELTVKIWGWLYYSDEIETNPDKYWRSYSQRMYGRARSETNPSRTIKRVVESITLSGDGPQEKIARIYDYVQNEIRNLGFRETRDAEGNPDREYKRNNSADETIRRRYGTPREINRLFIAMLRAAGLDARVAEMTTRDENFFHRSFPDSFQLNGEVAAVISAGDSSIQFYDPGTPFCPLGMLSWEKEAVTALVYDRRDLRFVETPVTEASRSGEERRFRVTPSSDGRVDVRVETKIGGHHALELRNGMVDLHPASQRKRFADPVRTLLPSAVIDETGITISNLTNRAAPVEASYSFTVPQFASGAGSRLLLRPAMLAHPDENRFAAPRRSNNIYFPYPWSESERMAIESPVGYEIEQLPDPVELDIGAARYSSNFTREGRRVIYERRLEVNAITFTVDQYSTVKAFFDRVHQADRAMISFKQ
ncbi:MAG TPA: DUF3857 and transglutaminase domain-containing protein [Blastocatellia bacterium]|nr:DUF3857 and transglutaminase domain-containing protein [Blastocatellia bacterium]